MRTKIAVCFGGPSAEHEVSVSSGIEVLRHINRQMFDVRAVFITRTKELFFVDCQGDVTPSLDDCTNPAASELFNGPFTFADGTTVWKGCSVAFLALHGAFGEDGLIQGYFESIGLPYTGPNVFASAVAMNKITSKFLYLQNGIHVPPYALYGRRFTDVSADTVAAKVGFPCFVKCPQSGSSRLMGRAANTSELSKLLDEFSPFADEILVEKGISGPEFTCGVLDNKEGIPFALPPIEIIPKDTFFTYDAKYTAGASDEIVPAPRPEVLLERIRNTALEAHQVLGCTGISRTDMILSDDTLYVLETNTLPGLTANSLIPKSFKAIGGTFPELIELLIIQALSRKAAVVL